MSTEPTFEVVVEPDTETGDRLVVGLANPGVVGLTVLDHVVREFDADQIGHVWTRNVATVTPFADGRPRRPIRLYAVPELDATVVLAEIAVSPVAAEAFAEALFGFADDADLGEVTAINAVPYPHGPADHAVFGVATDDYRDRHPAVVSAPSDGGVSGDETDAKTSGDETGGETSGEETDVDGADTEETVIRPLQRGFFDGIVGVLAGRGLDRDTPPVGVLVTPAHPPGPDFEASLLVIEALEALYGVAVDESRLREQFAEQQEYYARLSAELAELGDGEFEGREYAESGGMYM
ncbi:proteasome assembly chaperone family protein [Halobaculum sp. MBLA0147]|uniref:proteasome assembly chaperone family protein n=1 Tax=Halobaculum sp. MBLA0147 TaxID=3079934 RepID=UPI0035249B66